MVREGISSRVSRGLWSSIIFKEGMNHLVSWAFLLVAPLLAHPITDSAEMPYPGPEEEHGLGPLEDLSLSEQSFSPQDAAVLRLSTLLPGDDIRSTRLLNRALSQGVSLEKAGVFSPLSHVLGIRKHFRKRAGTADCFWKYCV